MASPEPVDWAAAPPWARSLVGWGVAVEAVEASSWVGWAASGEEGDEEEEEAAVAVLLLPRTRYHGAEGGSCGLLPWAALALWPGYWAPLPGALMQYRGPSSAWLCATACLAPEAALLAAAWSAAGACACAAVRRSVKLSPVSLSQ